MPGKVERIIDGLYIKRSTGPNSIPVFILKSLKSIFSFFLSQLINLSFKVEIYSQTFEKLPKLLLFIRKNANLISRITDRYLFRNLVLYSYLVR